MSISSTRIIATEFSGDVTAAFQDSAANAASPGKLDIVTLASGANTITPPTGGTSPVGVTIIPPAANVIGVTLKGVTGDTGIALHLTHPTSLGLGSSTGTFVLTAASTIAGVRLIWY